ncbi:MAG TPA: Hsp33 family molecular chaperone HslO [Nevskiales bacterium]|nr:Hsp33 family molecular chaperone HslO [Nevskiales bacterium]
MTESPDSNAGLWRFLFEQLPVRGALLRIGTEWGELLAHRPYPDAVRQLLGEAIAAAPLLASTLKTPGRLTLQAESEGAIKLLLVQVSHVLEVRGMARHEAQMDGSGLALLGNGRMALIVEPAAPAPRYQTLVPLVGSSLQESLMHYFRQSEQLPTWLMLHADASGLAGLMLQRLPAVGDVEADAIEEGWHRLGLLADTLQVRELMTLPIPQLLQRLFHQEDLRLFEPQPVHLRCRCSHGRISEMLLGLGRKEVDDILAEQGRLQIECGFCGRSYTYLPAEVSQLFAASTADPAGGSRH